MTNKPIAIHMNLKLMTKLSLCLAVCALGCFCATPAKAALAPLTYTPNPADLNDLDHHMLYTWRIDNISLNNLAITGATLTFKNIANWDASPNVLHIHLLDTAINPGVASFQDDFSSGFVSDMTDDFVSPRFHNDPKWLVAAGTRDTLLGNPSFTTNGTDYTISFTAAQIATLTSYINAGHDIAFGFDPDCHFFNDGIKFTLNVTPVPEVANILPVALLLVGAIGFEIRRRRGVTT
jgi:hypothetical protein